VIFNAAHEPLEFKVPEEKWGTRWRTLIDTAEPVDHMSEDDGGAEYEPGQVVPVEAWTLVLLQRTAWRPKP
jgi:isoamylase